MVIDPLLPTPLRHLPGAAIADGTAQQPGTNQGSQTQHLLWEANLVTIQFRRIVTDCQLLADNYLIVADI